MRFIERVSVYTNTAFSLSVLLSTSVILLKLIFSIIETTFVFFCAALGQCFLLKLIFYIIEITLLFSVVSLLIAVSSMQKSMASSFIGGTCSFVHYYLISMGR